MSSTYTPKEFGQLIGRATKTLQKWDREGRLKAHRSPQSNRRFYTHDQYLEYMGLKAGEAGKTIVYARVSTVAQKADLANQMVALKAYCESRHIKVDEWMQDIASGLNFKRKQFGRLMEQVELGQVRRIIIAHQDRLVRFGYDYFEAFCERHNTVLIVVNGDTMSPAQELVQDLLAIVTDFGARLHGLRSYKKVLKEAALPKEEGQ
jgi:YD repeat-containing protein